MHLKSCISKKSLGPNIGGNYFSPACIFFLDLHSSRLVPGESRIGQIWNKISFPLSSSVAFFVLALKGKRTMCSEFCHGLCWCREESQEWQKERQQRKNRCGPKPRPQTELWTESQTRGKEGRLGVRGGTSRFPPSPDNEFSPPGPGGSRQAVFEHFAEFFSNSGVGRALSKSEGPPWACGPLSAASSPYCVT